MAPGCEPCDRCPTYVLESTVVAKLSSLLSKHSKQTLQGVHTDSSRKITSLIFLRQGIPTLGTFVLLLGGVLSTTDKSVLHSIVLVFVLVLYTLYSFLQFMLLRARATELNNRTVEVMRDVLRRWNARLSAMQTCSERDSANFRLAIGGEANNASISSQSTLSGESFVDSAMAAARSLRLVPVRLKHQQRSGSTPTDDKEKGSFIALIPKSLVVKGMQRFNEDSLSWETYREPVDVCKLIDALIVIMERDAIMLKPLIGVARPPRLPNLRIDSLLEEDVDTTDESDADVHVVRSTVGGRSVTAPPHRVEYFFQRIFTLAWMSGVVVFGCVGAVRLALMQSGNNNDSLGTELLTNLAITLLGLLPLNAFLVNRLLMFFCNASLHWKFQYILRRHACSPSAALECDLPSPSFSTVVSTVKAMLAHPGALRLPLFLARSTVETLGMVTVVAELDSAGILTDMVPLPVRLLVIKENRGGGESSSSSDEDERLFISQKSLEATRKKKKEMKLQIRRKRFQEERFTELKLTPSVANDALAVEFAEVDEYRKNYTSVHPVCLCLLLHALAPPPKDSAQWADGLRFVDRCQSWAHSAHWIPKAGGFDDSIIKHFEIICRIFCVKTVRPVSGADCVASRYPEQCCGLLCRDASGQLHLFVIGTTKMVVESCSSYWTGKDIEEFDDHEMEEVQFFADKQWAASQGVEAVAMAHRVLPDRYLRFVNSLRDEAARRGRPVEKYFLNGREVVDSSNEPGSATAPSKKASSVANFDAPPLSTSCECASSTTPLVVQGSPSASHFDHTVSDSVGLIATSSSKHLLSGKLLCAGLDGSTAVKPKLRRVLSSGDMPLYHGGPLEADATLSNDTFLTLMMRTSHTLLGLVGLRDSVRPHVETAVSALDEAGIRFMHFGSGSEQRTKAFGDRIGLETDWNCCISLKAESVALDPHSIRAQLPFGIKSIRKHIIYVDPIPLQVSLFSHSRGVSARSMLSVLQDNHEVVVTIGSVLNHSNARSFVQSDYAVGVIPSRQGPSLDKQPILKSVGTEGRCHADPLSFSTTCSGSCPPSGPEESEGGLHCQDCVQPLLSLTSELLGTGCSMNAGRCPAILCVVTRMIRESRRMLSAMSNCSEFILHANCFIVLIHATSLVMGLPLFLSAGSTLFLLNVTIPILGLSCTYNMYNAMDPMRVKQCKQNFDTRMDILKHSFVVFSLRYIPSVVVLMALALTAVAQWCEAVVTPWDLTPSTLQSDRKTCLEDVRSFTCLTVVLWLVAHSLVHLSRHQVPSFQVAAVRRTHNIIWRVLRRGDAAGTSSSNPDRGGGSQGGLKKHQSLSFPVFASYRWMLASLLSTFCSVAFHFIVQHGFQYHGRSTRVLVLLLFCSAAYPAVIVALDHPIKAWRLKRYNDMQKFRTLSYGTRLGMHSPRGDYEQDDDSDQDGGEENQGDNGRGPESASPDSVRGGSHAGGSVPLKRRLREFLFRWTSMNSGKLELNCVCCDHEGGHAAQYCSS